MVPRMPRRSSVSRSAVFSSSTDICPSSCGLSGAAGLPRGKGCKAPGHIPHHHGLSLGRATKWAVFLRHERCFCERRDGGETLRTNLARNRPDRARHAVARHRRNMRAFGLLSALLVAVHLRAAAGLSMCGSWQRAAVLRPFGAAALRRTALVCKATDGLVNADSTLAQLRAYVKENGLDVKTAGPGRNKEAILSDILRITQGAVWEKAATPEPEPEMAVKEETAVPQTSEPPAPADAGAATTAEAATEAPAATGAAPEGPPPPDGFYWGATF